MKSTEKNKKQKQVNQNKGRGALEKWAPMVEKHMNRKESKKKKNKERGLKENQDKMQMNLSTPTHKNMWKHGKPKDKRRSNGGKKRRLHWWRSNKWPKSDAQTWKQKKTRNEELIGNSRRSL